MVDRGETSGARFWAERDGLVLGFDNGLWSGMPAYDADGGITLSLRRAAPSWLGWFTWPGAVLGGILTWFLAAGVSRRLDAAGASGPFAGLLTGVALLLQLPAMMLWPVPDVPGDAPFWAGYGSFGVGAAVLGLLPAGLLVAAALLPALRRAFGWARRRPRLAGTGSAVVVLGVAAALLVPPLVSSSSAALSQCRPAPGPPPAAPESEVATSRLVRVYVDPASTADQRNLITAAIRRSWAGGPGELIWDPGSDEFREVYCGGGAVPAAAVPSLPYFFPVDLGVASDYPALMQEIDGMAGIVAVQRVPES
ncbi:hypothetical protein [Symbioplanes lichenis]|uniref:hypothetical protein n=1 Tax=Symbioplanes lichenis TaxID=1629072 RepID=UPI002738498A|nr:hypothetical protein [Actinoplanes lichenis]